MHVFKQAAPVVQETSSFVTLTYIMRFLYGDNMFLPFRKMKNLQVKTEKQRMLHQTMAKVRPLFYHLFTCATPVAFISNC